MTHDVAAASSDGKSGHAMPKQATPEWMAFQRSFLTAFLCGTGSDWLKGPYIYRLYEARGFKPQEITLLFAAGYMSSAFFGLVAGVMTDALGRRRMCLVFCALYLMHCVMHALNGFVVLLVARAVSGVATALLFSAFEAWLVAEHARRFADADLAALFAVQTQGNALVAVAAGAAAQGAVLLGGYGAPLALGVPLLLRCAWEVGQWPENAGCSQRDLRAVTHAAMATMSWTVARVGLLQCLFEGSMHVFVFLWTPCLQRGGLHVPHGLIFSLYMLCMMLGGRLCSGRFRPPLGLIFGIAASCLATPCLTENLWCNLAAFCCFEWCVGCYFPQIALLRSHHLDDKSRGATITLFRVPFNCIVVAVLVWGRALPPQVMLLFASGGLALGSAVYLSLAAQIAVPPSKADASKAD
mmetsp:Transcript_104784/g.291815  ORF Transcript_104784/g.291815 Transcript_104784/m.291815 type:complete len:411 (-) Transcript_104784:111-1343(-)|eukprot:CAMPEP_0179026490 /NCGR_PEP_ID=MMETSP0796-20121207/8539_1 /TAXON_ID=73915 /ORGANISM="Pyrodinium bahamense, Strain pbaha01" /LENGTH=410 /DNA_ID=CAMNT_0020722567 /DNA_START=73 /DNA_END=1305 /DNA_ORIENTATION=-